MRLKTLICLCFTIGCGFLAVTDGLAVMSIDLGSEFMKIAIVRPGVPMEIALNKESRRKTPVIVAMRDGERTFSDPASSVAVKYPWLAYRYLQDLLGKQYSNPMVENFQQRFPYYTYGIDENMGTVYFKHDEKTDYTVEELFAMILECAKETATDFAEQPVTDTVITVPAFFNQAERRALLRAANLTGLKVLQLMNNHAAVALNYGVFRRKSFNATAVHYMFYDMGSTSTTVSIVSYAVVKQKNAITGSTDSFPQVTVKGVGFDRSLGAREIQFRLRDHLANEFNKQGKTKTDVRKNHRSMAKLYKEAGRVMLVLSANTDHYAQVEGLLEDHDFKYKVTREMVEEMNKDLYERIGQVVKDAFSSSEVLKDELVEVILMGGGTRIPKVQENIRAATGREELGKGINTDEAAALGAVYQAAYLSKGFRVKKFNVKDANLFPILVEFEKVRASDDEQAKLVKRVLFGRNNPFPQKKVMTFNKHTKDFSFNVAYGDISFMSQKEQQMFGSLSLAKARILGNEDAHSKHAGEAEAKGVKAHFKMDESGVLSIEKIEALFEKTPPPESEADQSTLSKLGASISNLFGGGEKSEDMEATLEKGEDIPDKGDANEDESENGKKEESENAKKEESENAKKDGDKPSDQESEESEESAKKSKEGEEKKEETKESGETKEGEDGKKSDEKKDDEKKDGDKKDDKKEREKYDTKADKKKDDKTEEKEKKPKIQILKENLEVETEVLDIQDPTKNQIQDSKEKIEDWRRKDIDKRKLLKAKNELESYIVEAQDRLYQTEYEKCSQKETRVDMQTKLSLASDWLYEQDENTARKEYESKTSELKVLMKDLYERVKELKERPEAVKALNGMLNYTEHFLVGMANYTGEDQPFTEVESNTLKKLIEDTKTWNKTVMEEQANTPLYEKPKVTIEDIARKLQELDREVKYLVNKAKTFRPKPKPKTEETEGSENSTKKASKKPKKPTNSTSSTNSTKPDDEDSAIEVEDDEYEQQEENQKPPPKETEEAEQAEEVEVETDTNKEGVEIKISPPPGEEETGRKKPKQKREGEQKTEEEEPLQLDGKDTKTDSTSDKKKETKDSSSKTANDNAHNPGDEL